MTPTSIAGMRSRCNRSPTWPRASVCGAAAVELKGLDYPIVVQPIADMAGKKPAGCDYRLIAGHRRYKAMEVFLKWTRVPAMIRRRAE